MLSHRTTDSDKVELVVSRKYGFVVVGHVYSVVLAEHLCRLTNEAATAHEAEEAKRHANKMLYDLLRGS